MLPIGFKRTDHIDSVPSEQHPVNPVQPRLVGLVVDVLLRTVHRRYGVKVECVLRPRFSLNIKGLAVGSPERRSEILVVILVEVRPSGEAILNIHDSDPHLRIVVAALRVARHTDRASRRGHVRQSHRRPGVL